MRFDVHLIPHSRLLGYYTYATLVHCYPFTPMETSRASPSRAVPKATSEIRELSQKQCWIFASFRAASGLSLLFGSILCSAYVALLHTAYVGFLLFRFLSIPYYIWLLWLSIIYAAILLILLILLIWRLLWAWRCWPASYMEGSSYWLNICIYMEPLCLFFVSFFSMLYLLLAADAINITTSFFKQVITSNEWFSMIWDWKHWKESNRTKGAFPCR